MVQAGIDVVRMNFSHGTADDHRARAEGIRAAAAKFGRTVGILVVIGVAGSRLVLLALGNGGQANDEERDPDV